MTTEYEDLRQQRLSKASEFYQQLLASIPPLRTEGVDNLRAAIEDMNSGRELVPGVSYYDIDISGPNGPVPTRIYTPDDYAEAELGVYLHTHFGGFVAGGGISTHDGENSLIAASVPCIVIAPNFRLPPEHRFPAGLQDCWAVLNWIADNGGLRGWDSSKIALGGGCSGGNLAAVLALKARDAGRPKISLQLLQSWVADANATSASQQEYRDGYGLRHDDHLFVVDQYISQPSDRDDWRVSPLLADSVEGVAPAFISVGEWDILKDEDLAYAQRLEAAGVPVKVELIPCMGHFPNPENMAMHIDQLAAAIRPEGIGVVKPVVIEPKEFDLDALLVKQGDNNVTSNNAGSVIDGKWKAVVKMPMMKLEVIMDLRVEGEKLLGSQLIRGDLKEILDGEVDGADFCWTNEMLKPVKTTVEISGTVLGDRLTGLVSAGKMGPFKMTGVRIQ